MDRPYRVSIGVVKPIIVHASSPKQAEAIFVEYLRQAESNRILVEPCELRLEPLD